MDAANDVSIADLHVLTDQIGGHLLAHSRPGIDEGSSDFSAHHPRGLQHPSEGQCLLGFDVEHPEEHQAGECETLADRLQES